MKKHLFRFLPLLMLAMTSLNLHAVTCSWSTTSTQKNLQNTLVFGWNNRRWVCPCESEPCLTSMYIEEWSIDHSCLQDHKDSGQPMVFLYRNDNGPDWNGNCQLQKYLKNPGSSEISMWLKNDSTLEFDFRQNADAVASGTCDPWEMTTTAQHEMAAVIADHTGGNMAKIKEVHYNIYGRHEIVINNSASNGIVYGFSHIGARVKFHFGEGAELYITGTAASEFTAIRAAEVEMDGSHWLFDSYGGIKAHSVSIKNGTVYIRKPTSWPSEVGIKTYKNETTDFHGQLRGSWLPDGTVNIEKSYISINTLGYGIYAGIGSGNINITDADIRVLGNAVDGAIYGNVTLSGCVVKAPEGAYISNNRLRGVLNADGTLAKTVNIGAETYELFIKGTAVSTRSAQTSAEFKYNPDRKELTLYKNIIISSGADCAILSNIDDLTIISSKDSLVISGPQGLVLNGANTTIYSYSGGAVYVRATKANTGYAVELANNASTLTLEKGRFYLDGNNMGVHGGNVLVDGSSFFSIKGGTYAASSLLSLEILGLTLKSSNPSASDVGLYSGKLVDLSNNNPVLSAVYDVKKYNLWICGTQVTGANCRDGSISGVKRLSYSPRYPDRKSQWYYSEKTNTLTLENISILPDKRTLNYGIQSSINGLQIEILGTCSIAGAVNPDTNGGWSCIRVNKNTVFTGDGELTLNASNDGVGLYIYADESNYYSSDLRVVLKDLTLNAKGSYGIGACNRTSYTSHGAVVVVNNATINAVANGYNSPNRCSIGRLKDLDLSTFDNCNIKQPLLASFSADSAAVVTYDGYRVRDTVTIGPKTYNLWIGGTQVTAQNASNITGSGITGSASYNPSTRTLTLNNFKYNGSAEGIRSTLISSLNIVLVGNNNTITSSGADGIYSNGDVVISGTGSLTVNASGEDAEGIFLTTGLLLKHSLTIQGGAKVTVNSANDDGIKGGGSSLIVDNSSLTATGNNAASIRGFSDLQMTGVGIMNPAGASFSTKLKGIVVNDTLTNATVEIGKKQFYIAGNLPGLTWDSHTTFNDGTKSFTVSKGQLYEFIITEGDWNHTTYGYAQLGSGCTYNLYEGSTRANTVLFKSSANQTVTVTFDGEHICVEGSRYAQTFYDLWINGVQITSFNYNTIGTTVNGVSGYAFFDYSTNTLHLQNATIAPPTGAYGIQSSIAGLTIKAKGTNTINGYPGWSAVRINKSATISGGGTLKCNAQGVCYGVFIYNQSASLEEPIVLTVQDQTVLEAIGVTGVGGYPGRLSATYGAELVVRNATVKATQNGTTENIGNHKIASIEWLHKLTLSGVIISTPANAVYKNDVFGCVVDNTTDTPIAEQVIIEPTASYTNGVIPSEFSVGTKKKVVFSQGNLQYQASTQTWRFAEHQYDYVGGVDVGTVYENDVKCSNAYIADDYTGWIDAFGQGTGNNPTLTIKNSTYYLTFTDWGTNAISNGGNQPNLWRTLTKDEWVYLFYNRPNAASLCGMGTIHGESGMILLPDDWTLPSGLTFNSMENSTLANMGSYYYTQDANAYLDNAYTLGQWAQMEANGAIFLPAGGGRNGTTVVCLRYGNWGGEGYYWSSSDAYCVYFGPDKLRPQYTSNYFMGYAVRLIQDVEMPCENKTTELTETACESYVWRGETYTQSGNYERHFTTADGCDSLVILHLTILEPSTYETSVTTAGSYEWAGNVLTESGDYYYRLTNAAGCDSIVMLHLTIAETPKWNEGVLPGAFSVADDRQVHFSQGNLQYNPMAGPHATAENPNAQGAWRFAEKQTDYTSTTPHRSGEVYAWSDLHYWGMTGYNDHSPLGSGTNYDIDSLNGTFYDWGLYNAISNGGNVPGLWRTLTRDEFHYLIYTRPNAEQLVALGRIDTVKGMIFLPDNAASIGLSLRYSGYNSNWPDNEYTAAEWAVMEAEGAVFLPAAEYSLGGESQNRFGSYLTATADPENNQNCYRMMFLENFNWTGTNSYFKNVAQSVRLVRDINNACTDKTSEFSESADEFYVWNGRTYTKSGDYIQTFPIIGGCDSIVTLHLTINHVDPMGRITWRADDEDIRILDTIQSEVTVRGLTFYATPDKKMFVDYNKKTYDTLTFTHRIKLSGTMTNAGRYLHFNVKGDATIEIWCLSSSGSEIRPLRIAEGTWSNTIHQFDSISGTGVNYCKYVYRGGPATLYIGSANLGINILGINLLEGYAPCEDKTSEFSITAETSYTWNGLTYTASGDYQQIFTAADGCDSIVTLHLTIFDKVYYVAGNGEMGNPWCDGYFWDAAGSPMTAGTITFYNVPAGVYEFKITDGAWHDGGIGEWAFGDVDHTCSSANVLNSSDTDYGNVKLITSVLQDITIQFDGSLICVFGAFEDPNSLTITSYTIVGTGALLGSSWALEDTENDMVETSTGVFTLVKSNISLTAGSYEYKVVGNRNYSVFQWPAGNNTLTIDADGDYDVTFTFVPATNQLTAVAVPHEEQIEYEMAYVCDFTKQAASNNSQYYNTWTYDNSWTICGGSTYNATWSYCKFGGKAAALDATNPVHLGNIVAFDKDIRFVKVYFHAGSFSNEQMVLNAWGIDAYSANDYAESHLLGVVAGGAIANTADTVTLTIDKANSAWWAAGNYLRVFWDVSNSSNTNGIIWVDKVEFYVEKDNNATGLDESIDQRKAVKILRNGHIYILRDGRIYTIHGQEIKEFND